MVDRKKSVPEWFDPLGIRGSILDPLATLNEAARIVAPGAQPLTWMVTTAARRLKGRKVRIRSNPSIEARVARIDEVVPATEIPVPMLSESIGLWKHVVLSVDQVFVGGKPIDRVDVVATDIRVRDSTARQMLISQLNLLATLTPESANAWLEDLGINGEFDFDSETVSFHPVPRLSWLAVIAEPSIRPRGAEARAKALKVGPVRVPIPKWISRSRSVDFPHLSQGFELTDMKWTPERHLCMSIEGRAVDLPIDIPRLITEIGVDGTMSVVDILRPYGRAPFRELSSIRR